ncbi:MAG: sigma-54-dependent Fis family transcriptional regulator [Deltaproteobacteria bacterium]|nr:sigma-54-dependent Fis family transcriptional regulator [Deltaproteobacteria bacterium]MBW1717971.1 sigma-54-dependent Fis family transcriptional regulator [Deltaproteobacteria bacterium]MBW1931569.1 sigma-54-dependent Fis family transcriptional regulator [Deltaproteobacteria bacterium]MBW1937432.1 sigma-54-dependent Fis family transcriptional regulator [Deltaproteobacteria bacterium]MBW1964306.1 sigma-54-dependent Fis family transcriptional regulator [Deltaproteobacteria bacterium]
MDLMIGNSPPIRRIKDLINQVVNTDLNVLICGESGVGKELVARTLHELSSRRDYPLVKVNCAALPSELLESELFGYERGAFTGAVQPKPGKFELANEGTILLDEIGDMPVALQAKLLQVLQDSEFARVGGVRNIHVNTWVISATNHNLNEDVRKGRFREDFYYRINIIKIVVPPLRDRKEDIPYLLEHFIRKYRGMSKGGVIDISGKLEKVFAEYNWPGNIRELENYVRRLIVLKDPDLLKEEILGSMGQQMSEDRPIAELWTPDESLINSVLDNCRQEMQTQFPSLKKIRKKSLARIEKVVIEEAIKRTNGNRKKAAQLLQISYKALLYKIKDFGVKVSAIDSSDDSLELKLPKELEPFV